MKSCSLKRGEVDPNGGYDSFACRIVMSAHSSNAIGAVAAICGGAFGGAFVSWFTSQKTLKHLKQIVRAGLGPAHLLLIHHALAHHLIHRGLREGRVAPGLKCSPSSSLA